MNGTKILEHAHGEPVNIAGVTGSFKVLVACEESQAITKEFRKLGVEAYSCDLQECSGGHPEWHLKTDVTELLKLKWDLLIAHPPCTRLTIRAQYWNKIRNLENEKQEAIDFFLKLANAPVKHKAIENPIGIMSSIYRKPNQIIQPYQFGDTEQKATCLWTENLPKLKPTKIVEPVFKLTKNGKKLYFNDKLPKNNERQKLRSKTFPGIAKAIAEQYTAFLSQNYR